MPDVRTLRAPVPRRWVPLVHTLVVVTLLLYGLALGFERLGPSSLWLDDAWQALVVEADGPGELMLVGVTAPGFAWLLSGWLAVFGFSETTAQALPFVLGLLAPVGLYLVTVSRLRPPAALVGAILLASAPVHVTYATRVKPFTLSSFCAVGLIGLGLAVVDDPRSRRRWWGLALVSAAAVVASAFTAPIAAAAFAAGLLAAIRTNGRSAWRWVVGPAAAFGVFAAVWWFAVVRVAVTDALHDYWSARYVSFDGGMVDGLRQLGGNTAAFLKGFLPFPTPVVVALFVVAGILVVRRGLPSLSLAGGPIVIAVLLGLLALAPLGGGRTDIYLYPCLALLLAIAVDRFPGTALGASAFMAAALAIAVLANVRPASPYPQEDVRPLVSVLERSVGPGEGILVYSPGIPAFALYTTWPVELVRGGTTAKGFTAKIGRENVHVLPRLRRDGAHNGPVLRRLVEPYDRTWVVASHLQPDYGLLLVSLDEFGYEPRIVHRRPGAELVLWERRDAGNPVL